MARGRTRRIFPVNIRGLGGAGLGSSVLFGSTADNYTQLLHTMRDTEALRKLADGDPETFLAYWDKRKDTMNKSSNEYATLAGYATKAQGILDFQKKETEYISSKNWSGYSQLLKDHLAQTTDATERNKLMVRIQQVDHLARASGASGIGADIRKGVMDLNTARSKARDELAENHAISQDTMDQLKLTAQRASDVFTNVETSGGFSAKVQEWAERMRSDSKMGSDNIVATIQHEADALKLSEMGLTEAGLGKRLTAIQNAKSDAARATMLAGLGSDLAKAQRGLWTPGSIAQMTDHLAVVQKSLEDDLGRLNQPRNPPALFSQLDSDSRRVVDAAYEQYKEDMKKGVMGRLQKPVTPQEFYSSVTNSTDPAALGKALGYMSAPGIDLGQTANTINDQFNTASYDVSNSNQTFKGSKTSVANANAIVTAVGALSKISTSKYYGVRGSNIDLYNVGTGKFDPGVYKGYDESDRAARRAGIFGGGAPGTEGGATGAEQPEQQGLGRAETPETAETPVTEQPTQEAKPDDLDTNLDHLGITEFPTLPPPDEKRDEDAEGAIADTGRDETAMFGAVE